MSNLVTLELGHNELTQIPQSLGQLSDLTELLLNHNQLRKVPQSFGQLLNLTTLRLDNNQLRHLPKELGQLSELTQLHLDNNQLRLLPGNIGELPKLLFLDVCDNHLRQLPGSLIQLSSLKELYLDNNLLSYLPEGIEALSNLTNLQVSYNQLRELPENIGALSSLKELILSNNRLEYLPDGIGALSTLVELDLERNQLQQLPQRIGDLMSLAILDVSNNPLTLQEDIRLREIFQHRDAELYLPLDYSSVRIDSEYDNKNLREQVESLKILAAKFHVSHNCCQNSVWKDLDKTENNSFKYFLDKIWTTNDANKNEESQKILLSSLMNIFEKMEKSPEFTQLCLSLAEESVNSCGDRVSLGLVQMQIAEKTYPEGEASMKDLFASEKVLLKAEMIFDIARDKVKNLTGSVDEIETYLMYFNQLKEELGVEINGMLYESCSNLDEKDIVQAKQLLSSIPQERVYERLLDNPSVQKRFEKEFEEIQNQEKFNTDKLENESDRDYMRRLEAMSKSLKDAKMAQIMDVCKR